MAFAPLRRGYFFAAEHPCPRLHCAHARILAAVYSWQADAALPMWVHSSVLLMIDVSLQQSVAMAHGGRRRVLRTYASTRYASAMNAGKASSGCCLPLS
jgi:hypothetical protein